MSFSGISGANISVPCPHCGHRFDATGGGDGTFSTLPDGTLVRVVTDLALMSRQRRQALLVDLQEAMEADDPDAARRAAESQAPASFVGLLRPTSHAEAIGILKYLVRLLVLVTAAAMKHDDVSAVVKAVVEALGEAMS